MDVFYDEDKEGISFTVNDIERLRIDPDGSFYVKGKLVIKDELIYIALWDFLVACGYHPALKWPPAAMPREHND